MPGGTALSGGPLPGYIAVDVTGRTSVLLSTDQMKWRTIAFTGTPSGNVSVTWPLAAADNAGLIYEVINALGGGFSLTCFGPSGNGFAVANRQGVMWDGVNMVAAEPGGSGATGSGAAAVTIPNGSTYTFTAAQAANQFLHLTGGNQAATLRFPPSASVAGRTWTFYNNTNFLETIKADGDPGNGVPIGAGTTIQVQIDETGAARQIVPTSGQIAIGVSATPLNLTVAQAAFSNIQLTNGGIAAKFVVNFPTSIIAGQEWIVANVSGFSCQLLCSGSVSPVTLQSIERKKIYFDGFDLQEIHTTYASSELAQVLAAGTTTFTSWDQVDVDYWEFSPGAGGSTVVWPNGGVVGQIGRRQTVANTHATRILTVQTASAPANKIWTLAPGETMSFVVDSGGFLVRQETFGSRRRVSVQMPSDADYTLVSPDFLASVIEVTSAVNLTATRNVILPTVDSHMWTIANLTANAQSITVKTAAGTGVTIANGKRQTVYGDGTNLLPAGGSS